MDKDKTDKIIYAFQLIDKDKIILKGQDDSVIELPLTMENLEMVGAVTTNEKKVESIQDSTETDRQAQVDKISWNETATKCLIQLYKENENTFKDPKIRNDEGWKIISDGLAQNGSQYTAKQSQNKFKHLKKIYMKCKDTMGPKGSGSSPGNIKYFDEMDEIFCARPNVVPVATASSSTGSQMNPDVVKQSFNVASTSQKRGTDMPEKKPKKQATLILETIKQNEESRERRHQEILRAQKEATDSYEKIMTKLIDKL